MAEDLVKPSGASKSVKPDAGGGVIRTVPVFGIVKNNVDPTRAGRLQVYISDFGGDNPDDPNNWATVTFMSPFYGFVEPTAGERGTGDFVANPASYGMWYSQPDLESTVICIFINGDPNYGFWIGCAPKPEALHMVPAIGSSENIKTNNNAEQQSFGGATRLPVTNINSNNPAIADSPNFLDEAKPVHSYVASILFKQGIIRDRLRGPISTSSQRESPSRVGWGVSTPGRPIYAGGYDDTTIASAAIEGKNDSALRVVSRRGGHSIVMDDGDIIGKDDLIRIRSAAGHQLLMSDDGQTIFIIHSNGQSWIEMGKEGTIDLFCTNSFNVRTQGDINLHADNNINIHAKKKLNLKAEDIYIQSEKSTSHNVGTDYKIETVGKYMLKVGGVMTLGSGGEASFASGATCYVNGSRVHLNTGNGPPPDAVAPLKDVAHTDTLFESVKGYIAAPGLLKSITSRAPAHSPWANANQGADVSTSNNAKDNLPAAPSPETAAATTTASNTPTGNPVQPAGLASVPPTPATSKAVTPQATGAIMGAVATNAATGPAAAAVSAGTGIVETTEGAKPALGQLAQSAQQLDAAKIIKPGSAPLVDALISSGMTIDNAMPNNLFTGEMGVASVKGFLNNVPAQMGSMASNFQQAQTALTQSGVMSGLESAGAIAGTVMSGVTAGVQNTIGQIQSVASNLTSAAAGVPGVASSVMNAMNSGNFSAQLAENSIGGLGSIASAVSAMGKGLTSSLQGITASAFGAIAAAIPSLPSGPTNLKTNANATLEQSYAKYFGFSDALNTASNLVRTAGQIAGGNTSRIASAISGGLNAVSRLGTGNSPAASLNNLTGVVGSVGAIGAALGSSSAAKVANQVNNLVRSTNQVTNGLATIMTGATASQGLGGALQVLGGLGSAGAALGNKNLTNATRKIGSVVNNSNQVLNAVGALATSQNIQQTLGAAGGIIGAAGRIAGVVSGSARATGLFTMPGGTLSVGTVVNKALGSMGISNNPVLGSVISNAVTSAVNNIAFNKSVTGGTGLPSLSGASSNPLGGVLTSALSGTPSVSSMLGNLQSSLGNLTGALGKIPAGISSSISSAISSIGFGGANVIKLPSIGINTNTVAEVNAQINQVLADSRIPKPQFDEENESASAMIDQMIQQNNAIDDAYLQIEELNLQANMAEEEYYQLEETLPPGDPEIDAARERWVALVEALQQKQDAVDLLINDAIE